MTQEPRQGDESTQGNTNERKSLRAFLIAAAALAGVLLVIGLWLFVGPTTPTEKKDFVQAVGVLLAAMVGLGGLYFTAQNLKQTRQNTERQLRQAQESTQAQLQQARESQERTHELTEQGQITERFTRAIEQLGATDDQGDKRLEIRLGGIYALERIARDSPERDYSTVMEVLSSYVRENTPQTPRLSKGSSDSASPSNEASTEADEDAKQPARPEAIRPTADIQAILDVLGRTQSRVPKKNLTRLDLHDANLEGANLQEANLQGTNLQGTYLYGADLTYAAVTKEQLDVAGSLEGATMPDGSTHD